MKRRCRRGYWWMSGNGIVQRALNNAWLREQGVPDLKAQWIELHYGKRNPNWERLRQSDRNRLMRTRMSGGVGAEGSIPSATRLDGTVITKMSLNDLNQRLETLHPLLARRCVRMIGPLLVARSRR